MPSIKDQAGVVIANTLLEAATDYATYHFVSLKGKVAEDKKKEAIQNVGKMRMERPEGIKKAGANFVCSDRNSTIDTSPKNRKSDLLTDLSRIKDALSKAEGLKEKNEILYHMMRNASLSFRSNDREIYAHVAFSTRAAMEVFEKANQFTAQTPRDECLALCSIGRSS